MGAHRLDSLLIGAHFRVADEAAVTTTPRIRRRAEIDPIAPFTAPRRELAAMGFGRLNSRRGALRLPTSFEGIDISRVDEIPTLPGARVEARVR